LGLHALDQAERGQHLSDIHLTQAQCQVDYRVFPPQHHVPFTGNCLADDFTVYLEGPRFFCI